MSARLSAAFAACAVGHVALDGLIASPWCVPDLTLVGMILVVMRAPSAWWAASLAAGFLTAAWAIRGAPSIFALYLAAGWSLAAMARQWDLEDPRIEGLFVAVVCAVLTLAFVTLDGAWSWSMVGYLLLRALATVTAWMVVRPLAARWLTS